MPFLVLVYEKLTDAPASRDDGVDDQGFLVLSEQGHSSADDGADASGSGLASRVEDQGHGEGLIGLSEQFCEHCAKFVTYFSLKSEATLGWQITRGFQIWSQKCRARSVAPANVWRARLNIRRFNCKL